MRRTTRNISWLIRHKATTSFPVFPHRGQSPSRSGDTHLISFNHVRMMGQSGWLRAGFPVLGWWFHRIINQQGFWTWIYKDIYIYILKGYGPKPMKRPNLLGRMNINLHHLPLILLDDFWPPHDVTGIMFRKESCPQMGVWWELFSSYSYNH